MDMEVEEAVIEDLGPEPMDGVWTQLTQTQDSLASPVANAAHEFSFLQQNSL